MLSLGPQVPEEATQASCPRADLRLTAPRVCVVQGGCAIRAQGWGRRCWSTGRERKLGAQGGRNRGTANLHSSGSSPGSAAWGKCVVPTEHTVKCTQEEDLRCPASQHLPAAPVPLLRLDPGTPPKGLGEQQRRCSVWASATLVGDADGPLGPWC